MREDRGGDGRSQRAVECPWLVRRDGTFVLFGGVWGLVRAGRPAIHSDPHHSPFRIWGLGLKRWDLSLG